MLFFFYGTLTDARALRAVLGSALFRVVGGGEVVGTLYDLGAYPGLVLAGGSSIPGLLVDVAEYATIQLDEYEDVADGLYARRLVRVEREAGGSLDAWTYVYLRSVEGLHRIDRWQRPAGSSP